MPLYPLTCRCASTQPHDRPVAQVSMQHPGPYTGHDRRRRAQLKSQRVALPLREWCQLAVTRDSANASGRALATVGRRSTALALAGTSVRQWQWQCQCRLRWL